MNTHRIRRLLDASAAAAVLALSAQRLAAIDITQSATFVTANQSLFSTGNATNYNFNAALNLLDLNLNTLAPITITDPITGSYISAQGSATASANVSLQGSLLLGSVGATVPYNVTLALPTFSQFSQDGFTIGVQSSNYTATGATLTATAPSLQFTTNLNFAGSATIAGSAQANFFGNTYGGSINPPTTLFNNSSSLNLLSFNTAADGTPDGKVQLLPTLFNDFSLGKFFSRAKATGTLIKNVSNAPNSAAQDKVILDALTFKTGFKTQDLFTSSFQLPNIAMGASNATATGITATGKGNFAQLGISLTALLAKVIPQFPPLAASASLDFVAGEASISATALNVQVNSALNLTQTDTVVPQQTTVGFNFGQMVSVRVLKAGATGALLAYQTVDHVSGLAPGDQLQFQNGLAAKSSINLTPIYTTSANLQSQFGLSVDLSLPIDVLQGKLKGEILGLSGSTSFGPLYTASPPLGTITLPNFYDQTFALAGFNTVTGGTITLSTSGYEWKTDPSNPAQDTNLFNPNNYSTGGTTPPSGQDVDISNFSSTRLVVIDNANADADHLIGTLSLEGNTEVDVPANRTLQLTGNLEFGILPGTVGLALADSAILNMTNATNAIIDGGGGMVQMNGPNSKLQTAADLTFLSGIISGQGTVQVTGDLLMGSATLISTANTLNVNANSLTYENNGGMPARLQATGGSQLIVTTAANNGIAGQAGGDRIEIQADTNSTVTLKVSSLISAHITQANGTVELASNMALSDIVNDGNIKATNNAVLSYSGGTLTNNGYFLLTAGSSISTLFPLELAGTGLLELQGASMTGANGSEITNDAGHTIRLSADGASFGTDAGGNGPTVVNNGVIEAALTAPGTATLRAATATSSFVNNGEIRGRNSTITLASGTFDNEDAFEAGQVVVNADGSVTYTTGNLIMTNSTLENLSASGDTITLDGGLYVLADGNSKMALQGPAATGTDFVNNAGIELLGTSGGVSNFSINGTDLSNMNSFTNDTGGMLVLGPGRSFVTTDFINNGSLMLLGNPTTPTVFGNVSNTLTGVIVVSPTAAGSLATLKLHGDTNGVATNYGDINVTQAGVTGDITLTITGDANATQFRNEGTVEVHNATLLFDNLTLNHGGMIAGAQSFQGGTWIVDSSTLGLTLDAAPTRLDANLTMMGATSVLQFNGGVTFEKTINLIGETGQFTLDTRDMTFINALENRGTITLANGSTLTAPAVTNKSTITGFGSLNAPVTNTGVLSASGGQLTFLQNVTNNGAIVAAAADPINEISAGGIGLDQNASVTGGLVNVQSGAALWGYGTVAEAAMTNDGTIMASDFYRSLQPGATVQNQFILTLDITPGSGASLTNNGQIIATAGQTLAVVSQTPGAPLNNTGTPATETDPASPGYLMVQFVTPVSGPPDPVNGHLILQNVAVQNGVLQVQGSNVDSNDAALPEDKQATVDGVNSTLVNVVIDVDQGILRDTEAGTNFSIFPQAGSVAEILDSTVIADNGAVVLLASGNGMQTYDLAGTTLLARNANSQLQLSNVLLQGGILSAENGGQIVINDSARFEHVINTAPLSVPQGKSLQLAYTFYNASGSLSVDGTLTLDGTVPIGGPDFIDSGSDFLGGALTINANGRLLVVDTARIIGTNFTNKGTLFIDNGQSLDITHSTDNATTAPTCFNQGQITVNPNGFLSVENPTFSNSGNVDLQGKITAPTYEQTAGSTKVNGILAADVNLKSGVLSGAGTITGNLVQTGGDVEPGNSPGTLTVGSYTLTSGLLHIQIASLTDFDRIVATAGNISLSSPGDINLDLSDVAPTDPLFDLPIIGFDIFDVTGPATISNASVQWTLTDAGPFQFDHFDTSTGIVYLSQVPEPASLALLGFAAMGRLLKRRRS